MPCGRDGTGLREAHSPWCLCHLLWELIPHLHTRCFQDRGHVQPGLSHCTRTWQHPTVQAQVQQPSAGEAPQLQVPPGRSEVSGMFFFQFHALHPSLGVQHFSKASPASPEGDAQDNSYSRTCVTHVLLVPGEPALVWLSKRPKWMRWGSSKELNEANVLHGGRRQVR